MMYIQSLLQADHSPSIIVVGDVMLDTYLYGRAAHLSPEAPVPVVEALGAKVTLLGLTGLDRSRELLLKPLHERGILTRLISHPALQTTQKMRIVSHHHQLLRLDFEKMAPSEIARQLVDMLSQVLSEERPSLVLFSDYDKGALQFVQAMLRLTEHYQLPSLVDPKGSEYSRYQGATLLTPNLLELQLAARSPCSTEEEIAAAAINLRTSYNIGALLVTRSEDGMSLFDDQGNFHLPAASQEVFDVTGAGDTVIAVLARLWSAQCSLRSAMHFANQAAGRVIQKFGTATISLDELCNPSISNRNSLDPLEEKILSEAALASVLELAKQNNERIVMTNGCFDILHAGHVQYLRKAKALGDRLLVCVNTDDSVRHLKGPNRPIIPLQERLELLAALGFVDWILPFAEATPLRLIEQIKPSYLVKGSDYTLAEMVGAEEVMRYGGVATTIDLLPSLSTSSIIQKIQLAGELTKRTIVQID